jgi:phospho-N-acetylmuramoyl-pentapeptide-transferase
MNNWFIFGVCALIAYVLTYLFILKRPGEGFLLGHDRGRKFAEGAEVNIGKPTGTGLYFTTVFTLVSMACIFIVYFNPGAIFGVGVTFLAMITGLLDDRSKKAWNEYIKGALDFGLSLLGAAVCLIFCFGGYAVISLNGFPVFMNPVLFFVLAVVLFVVSINATNATDGIDGLSGTLTILTIITLAVAAFRNGTLTFHGIIIGGIMVCCLVAYLLFNFFPSKVLMGDAGSRAIGFFIAFYAIYLKIPFAYLIVGLPFLADGGISILKITVGRLTKKKIILFKNIRTPLHEELKKNRGFSVPKIWRTLTIATLIIDVVYIAVVVILHLV